MEFSMPLESSISLDSNNVGTIKTFLDGERGDVIIEKDREDQKPLVSVESCGDTSKVMEECKIDEIPSTSDGTSEKDDWMDILGNGQLKKKVLSPGEPNSRPQKPDICEISFVGKLEDGTVVESEDLLEIHLGDNDTVQGLDFALALMDKGEEAEVVVNARFAYGSLGKKPNIPPESTIYYNIKLLSTKQEPLVSTLDIEQRVAIGSKKKERGNWWYTRDEHTLAIHSYRRALEYLDETGIPGTPDENRVQFLLNERLKTYNNLGASQMKISAFDAAEISFAHVLSSQPKNVKALFRKAKILKAKGEFDDSINVIRKALAIESDNKSLQQELSLLLAAQRKDNTKQRNLYKKMMGNSSNEDETDKKKDKKSNFGTFTWIAVISFAVAAIGAAAVRYKITL